MVCGVVFRVGLVRRGLVGVGLVTVARRISSVVCLAVGGVVLRLGVSVRVLAGIMPMLSVGIGLTGATCVAGAVAGLAGVGSLIRVGAGHVCRSLSTMRLFVAAAQEFFEGLFLLGCGGGVGCAVGGVLLVAAAQEFLEGPLLRGNGRCVGGAGCAVGSAASSVGASCGCAGCASAMRARTSRGGAGGASSVGAGGRSASSGSTMRARTGRGCTGGRCAGCASAMRTCAGSGSSGCAVGSAASAVGGAAGIRIHERVVVSAVRRAGGSVRGSRVPAGAGIAGCGRVRRRGGLGRTGYTVGAVARISGRKS